MIVYVNDITIDGNNREHLTDFVKIISEKFQIHVEAVKKSLWITIEEIKKRTNSPSNFN